MRWRGVVGTAAGDQLPHSPKGVAAGVQETTSCDCPVPPPQSAVRIFVLEGQSVESMRRTKHGKADTRAGTDQARSCPCRVGQFDRSLAKPPNKYLVALEAAVPQVPKSVSRFSCVQS